MGLNNVRASRMLGGLFVMGIGDDVRASSMFAAGLATSCGCLGLHLWCWDCYSLYRRAGVDTACNGDRRLATACGWFWCTDGHRSSFSTSTSVPNRHPSSQPSAARAHYQQTHTCQPGSSLPTHQTTKRSHQATFSTAPSFLSSAYIHHIIPYTISFATVTLGTE